MPKFLVENLSDKAVRLGIEPWADLEILAPGGQAIFEYVEPAEIEISIMNDDRCVVGIVSDSIKVSANGREKIFKLPPGDW
jgi:hypothetical protein